MIRRLWCNFVRWGLRYDEIQSGVDRPIRDRPLNTDPVVRISVYSAMNGRILEMVKPNNNIHVSDTKLMLVPEGENLSDTVSIMLLAEGMK